MSKITSFIKLTRPHHYIKNGFIFLPVLFGHKITDFYALINASWAFIAFSFAASSVYIFNDLRDIENDRKHPIKKKRPLASGQIKNTEAVILMLLLMSASFIIGMFTYNNLFLIILSAYLILNIVYSLKLKHISLIDVICVSIGFVLRVYAGSVVTNIWLSHWLVLMTFLIAMFLALAKRRDDLLLSGEENKIRKSLDGYNMEYISTSMR